MPHLHTGLAMSLLLDKEGNKDRYVRTLSFSGTDRREKYLSPVLTAATLLVLQHDY